MLRFLNDSSSTVPGMSSLATPVLVPGRYGGINHTVVGPSKGIPSNPSSTAPPAFSQASVVPPLDDEDSRHRIQTALSLAESLPGADVWPIHSPSRGWAGRYLDPAAGDADQYRQQLYDLMANLGRPQGGSAKTRSPWQAFEATLGKFWRAHNARHPNQRLALNLPSLTKAVQRKVLQRTQRYQGLQVRFNQPRC